MKIMMMVLRMNNAHDADEDYNEYINDESLDNEDNDKVELMRKSFKTLLRTTRSSSSTPRTVMVEMFQGTST